MAAVEFKIGVIIEVTIKILYSKLIAVVSEYLGEISV